jgi:hypothetical protein
MQWLAMELLLATAAAPAALADTAAGRADKPSPCSEEAFRAFDFWLGNWEVRTGDGKLAGYNRIESAEGGCVVLEHWTGVSGTTGMSMNYLDKTNDTWVQLWTGAEGSQVFIRGGPTEDGMLLEGRIHYVANGKTADFRGLWTVLTDGRVRQYFEESNDDGETWEPWFEGFYTRIQRIPGAAGVGDTT